MATNSLFIRLLSGFLAVIALLLSFNVVSYTFFYRNLHQEITTNSIQNLDHIVEQYEKQFQTIQLTLAGLYFHSRLNDWRDPDRQVAHDAVNRLVGQLRDIRADERLYLHDIIIQFRQDDFLLHVGGPDRLSTLYASSYRSAAYDPEFWRAQFGLDRMLRVYPYADFYSAADNRAGGFLPLVLRSTTDDDIYMVALLDAAAMFQDFSSLSNARFHIMDSQGGTVFRSDAREEPPALPDDEETAGGSAYIQAGEHYVFYRHSGIGDLTYALVIPNEKIADQMSRLNLALLLLLIVSLVVSVALSVFVSMRFYTPIQNIIRTIRQTSPHTAAARQERIDELRFIAEQIEQFAQIREHIGQNMARQQSQLIHFGYMRRLKSIYTRPSELSAAEKPFYMLLFQLTTTARFRDLQAVEQEKAANSIKELIAVTLTESFPEAVTLQLEKDQILSLLFADGDKLREAWRSLERLRQVFDRDKEYAYMTVSFVQRLYSPGQFKEAYDEALELLQLRRLTPETQVLTEPSPEPLDAGFTPAQEQELYANLEAGQGERVVQLLERTIQHMEKEGATAEQFRTIAREMIGKTLKRLAAANADIGDMLDRQSPYQIVKECADLSEYRQRLTRFLSEAAARFGEKREARDPVVDYVLEAIRERYHEDLSLDLLADGLGLTPSYVSRYMKEKTGSNFSDFLNEVRIRTAKELLAGSQLQIRDIATRVGYINVTSFIRMFKKVTGMTPSEYRRDSASGK